MGAQHPAHTDRMARIEHQPVARCAHIHAGIILVRAHVARARQCVGGKFGGNAGRRFKDPARKQPIGLKVAVVVAADDAEMSRVLWKPLRHGVGDSVVPAGTARTDIAVTEADDIDASGRGQCQCGKGPVGRGARSAAGQARC
ncbi:hypothetical protein CYG48_04415 [Neorhizobium sp. SOG26]|nr:hypothetical protein CYG48_04415 [Neorhizobium sp. SOG26]